MEVSFQVSGLRAGHSNFLLEDVNFELRSKDILGLVGRSGAGKSTLINALSGVTRPAAGSIRLLIDGKNSDYKSLIGYSPQSNSLFPYLTLEENLYTFGSLFGVSKNRIKANMVHLLKRLDLANCRTLKIHQLSGGMQKRADLAVSLIHSPLIIMLDEPFNGLDIALQRFIWEFLNELSKEGKLILISSHNIRDIQDYCNEFGLIEKGKYYNTKDISAAIRSNKEHDLNSFLERLFTRDLIASR